MTLTPDDKGNWPQAVKQNWPKYRAEAHRQWPSLTDEELDRGKGSMHNFVGVIMARESIDSPTAAKQVTDWWDAIHKDPPKTVYTAAPASPNADTWAGVKKDWGATYRAQALQQWPKLTADDLARAEHSQEELAVRVAERYNLPVVEATSRVGAWVDGFPKDTQAPAKGFIAPSTNKPTWDGVKRNWADNRDKASKQWDKLTPADLNLAEYGRDALVSRVAERYTLPVSEAQRQVDAWVSGLPKDGKNAYGA